MERLTGISQFQAVVVKLKGKQNELFCHCGTFRGLQCNELFVLAFS